jgi:hypothetical protein
MFRVVVAGSPGLRTFRPLRDALDHLLRDRLPDVTILTRAGAGYGTDALADNYATARKLAQVAYLLEHERHAALDDAIRARLAAFVRDADAAVIVFDEFDQQGRTLIALADRQGIPVRILDTHLRGRAVVPEPIPPDGP